MRSPNASADDTDRWVRHLIEPRSVKNNRVTEAYIRRYLAPVVGKPWQAEISGRLLSLAFDWRKIADREVQRLSEPQFRFYGMAYVDLVDLRASASNFDVFPTPRCADWAHADLVAWNAPLADVDPGVSIRRISADVARTLASVLNLAASDAQFAAFEVRRASIDATDPFSRRVRSILNDIIFICRKCSRRTRKWFSRLWK